MVTKFQREGPLTQVDLRKIRSFLPAWKRLMVAVLQSIWALIVTVTWKSCIVNRKLGVLDSKYVVILLILYPLPTGLVVARMRIVNIILNLPTPILFDLEGPNSAR